MTQTLLLKDILTYPVTTLPLNATVSDALTMMGDKGFSAIVVEDKNKAVGIFTERDAVISAFKHKNPEQSTLREVMSAPVVHAPASMGYQEAYRLINQQNLRHLVVSNADGEIAGIVSEHNFLEHLGNEFLVRFKEVGALMTRHIVSLPLNAVVDDAIQSMAHQRISCVLIEDNGKPRGIFTERDLVNMGSIGDDIRARPIAEVMSTSLVTVQAGDPLTTAIDKMDEANIRRLVVVDSNRNIAGLITRSDIVKQLYGEQVEQLKRIIRDREEELKETQEKLRMMNQLYQTQESLRDKQTKLELALEAGQISTWDWDVENDLIHADERMARLFGLDFVSDGDGVPLEKLLARISPDDVPRLKEKIKSSLETGEQFSADFRLPGKDGDKYLITWGKTSKNINNNVARVMGVIADITEQKNIQLSLKKSQQDLVEAQHIARIGYWELDAETLNAKWSDDIHRMLGTSSDERIGLGMLKELVNEQDWPTLKSSLMDAISRDQKHEIEYRITGRDGTEHWVYCIAQNIKDDSGRVTQLKGIIQNISERKKADELLRLSRNVFEHTLEGILITDIDGKIVEANPALSEITGFSREEILGKDPSIFKSGYHDPDFYREMWQALNESGQWRGEIWNRRKDGSIFPEWQNISSVFDDKGQRTHFVSVFSDISQIKKTQEKLDYLAHHDPLTNLPNRLLLNERINQSILHAKRRGSSLAVLFLDLDHFKHINDSLGHSSGDQLLMGIAERLAQVVRQDDTIARIGGDEFVVLLDDIGAPENAALMAEKILAIFERSFPVGDQQIGITASLGICIYPDDGDNAGTLLRNADSAMYRAKEEGRNNFQFYTEELTRNAFERILFENNLRHALDREQMVLYYQPKFDLATKKITGLEALIRWQHPELGLVSPHRFISIAEDSALIIPIGNWVLHEACRQAREWLDRGFDFGRIAVNISVLQIQRANLIESVEQALHASGLAPGLLELEIIEGMIMQQTGEAIHQLETLRNMGVTVAIDDFGTGYSSLSQLKSLPIQQLKVDQSFIHGIPDDDNDVAITDAIVALGRSLGLTVIAEGVETEEQLRFLKHCGCEQVQGFLFSKPLTAAAMQALLKKTG